MAMCCVLLSLPVSPNAIDDPNSLDSLIRDFASNRSRRRTGRLYEVVLPANFSGIEASIVTLKSGSLWMRGANFSLFGIPPRVLPWPAMAQVEFSNVSRNRTCSVRGVGHFSLGSSVVLGILGLLLLIGITYKAVKGKRLGKNGETVGKERESGLCLGREQ
nr:Lipoprotein signal peptidase [Ipomoea batatas]